MPDALRQDFTLFRGEDRTIRITMNANGSILGQTFAMYVRETDDATGNPLLTLTGTVTDAGSVSTPGVITCTVSEAQLLTLSKRGYFYSVKRTNTGAKRVTTYGIMHVLNDGENAPAS